jgi:SAM-dependent methyltransferase
MTELRDYDRWHQQYDDPGSSLSWRLRRVQAQLTAALDRTSGPVRVLSVCAGDGRDVIEVLRDRPDGHRVSAVLVELHPGITLRAREAAAAAGLTEVQVRERDAGQSDAYAGAVPAEVVLLVGIMGNISDEDIWRLVAFSRQLCAPGATLIWSRGLDGGNRNDEVRARYAAAGFTELGYETSGEEDGAAFGVVRYDGPPVSLEPGQQVFTFIR